MKDADKTKKQLIDELSELRQRIAELESSETGREPSTDHVPQPDRKVKALYAVAQTVSKTLNLDDLLQNSLEEVVQALEAGAGSIYLLDRAKKMLLLKAQQGAAGENIDQVSILGLNDDELQNLERWKDPGVSLTEILSNDTSRTISNAIDVKQIRSLTTVPLSAQGQIQGFMVIGATGRPELTSGEAEFLEAMSRQIAMGVENSLLNEKAQELTLIDELTGLYNRRYFYIVLHNEMHRAQRYGPSSSLVMLDIDGFKKYNEKYGHTAGDSALKALAQTLTADLRNTDMAFRYGGDEFVIILPATEADRAREVVNRIRVKWAQVSKAQYTAQVSVLGLSAGIVQFPRDADTADGLVLLAETALRESRGGGGSKSTLAFDLGAVHTDISDTATVDQVYALAATVDARDPFAYGHWERVASISDMIGKAAGMPEDEVANLHTAALLHDIGKVSVPDSIITKPDKLTESEWEIIKRHSVEGARIVSGVPELSALAPIIRHHHESYDGTGYPDGLKGEDIPLGSRIINIADAYDTLTTIRPYRESISYDEACAELTKCAGSQFDPALVEAFIRARSSDTGRD